MPPADQGPDYRDGGYGQPAPQAAPLPAAGTQGHHPYGAFSAAGYGDDGYSNPGYQGPSAQDAGIAGTRTVRGFVEPGQFAERGWPQGQIGRPGHALPSGHLSGPHPQLPDYPAGYGQPGPGDSGYAGPGRAAPGQAEVAYPPGDPYPAAESYHGADSYSQPWDYDQPLRYDDEEVYPAGQDGGYRPVNEYGSGVYPVLGGDSGAGYPPAARNSAAGPAGYSSPDYAGPGYRSPDYNGSGYGSSGYSAADYNGSEYSMPGVNGPGYDLSEIIGTGEFDAIGYDEPSYGRLSYDDPRYDDSPGYGSPRGGRPGDDRFDGPGFDGLGFDETRLDRLWLPADDVTRESGPRNGTGGFAVTPGRSPRSDFDRGPGAGSAPRADLNQTRGDLRALATLGRGQSRPGGPVLDETRIDRRVAATSANPRLTGATAALLAPPAAQPRDWAADTSLDYLADLDLTDEPVPAAFTTRTAKRASDRAAEEAAKRAGRRRGRSGDKRQWMALGAIAVVAAGTIGGVLMKYVFSGPSGPAHEIVATQSVDGYTRSASLEKQMQVSDLAQKVAKSSSGQASNVKYGVYQQGETTPGGNAQIFMFVGGNLANTDPEASVANFEQTYKSASHVSPGQLGGDASCTGVTLNGQSMSMCVWFDNDTFGTVVSPTMTTAKLASTMNTVRPSLETFAK